MKGLVGLVTGGASGLGKATVERFVKNGGKVVICDLPNSHGNELAKTLGEKNAIFCPANVTSEAEVKEALQATKKNFGRLDALVNCAGIILASQTYSPSKRRPHKLELFQKIIEVNLIGTFNAIRLACDLFAENEPNKDGQRGVIINTASIAAYDGQVGTSAYSASKGGVVGMTLPIARDLSSMGVRVCSIAPGFFNTPMADQFSDEAKMSGVKLISFPKRFGNPEEFAHLVESIIQNPMLNGVVIRIDGATRA